ncbi:MAG: hypothetical protein OEV91_09465 [Desulfobulbaceae bacterium]|nr:hypothetical protein [Desulfobulbaceae bacterium]
MKIDDLLYGPQGVRKNSSAGKAAASATIIDFQSLLAEQLRGGAPAAEPAGQAAPLAVAAPVSPALRLEGLSLTETAIDTLESFGSALGNKALSPAELAPYADAMEEEAVGLMSVKNQLPAGDLLGQLLERVATVTYLEAAKYRRGDYSA